MYKKCNTFIYASVLDHVFWKWANVRDNFFDCDSTWTFYIVLMDRIVLK